MGTWCCVMLYARREERAAAENVQIEGDEVFGTELKSGEKRRCYQNLRPWMRIPADRDADDVDSDNHTLSRTAQV